MESTINEVIEICIREFINLNEFESNSIEQLDVNWAEAPLHIQQHFLRRGYRKLPKGISRIYLSRYDVLEKSSHTEVKGGIVPNFTDENLNSILLKKNKALEKYKCCDQNWLVIGEGADFYSHINTEVVMTAASIWTNILHI